MAEEKWQDEVAKGWNLLSWEGEIQWFASKAEGARKKVLGGRLSNKDHLIGAVRNAEALGWDFYLQANPSKGRPGKVKLDRADITHWRYVIVDLDPMQDAALAPPIPLSMSDTTGTIPQEILRYGNRIFTGRGYQYWIKLDRAMPREFDCYPEYCMKGYLAKLKETINDWAPGWIVDSSCSDLARVVRCPGSINQKTGVRAVVEWMTTAYVTADYMKSCALPEPDPMAHVGNPSSLLDIFPHLTVKARTFMLDGVPKGGRHSAAFHTIRLLKELGAPYKKARGWVMHGARACEEGWDESFLQDVRGMLRREYAETALSD